MKKILSSPFIYPLILVIICLFIALKNYTPSTFLTGWDTLHPEFNFNVNFSRLFFGVWRNEQGLGAVSGHSAMADLPRIIILWLFHFFLPLNFLRYSYVFLCLILGPLGFYFLIKFLFINHKSYFINQISFLGALIYLFNLGTLQQFYVPFEMFSTQWAFLPWIILYSLKYIHSPKCTYLFIFALISFFSAPQAYAAHLWYPFFGIYLLFLLLHKSKKIIPLILITLAINSFWLLPNLYYLATSTDNPRFNLSNRLHSQEFLLKNRQTGTLADTSLIKGFYFNWDQYNFSRNNSEPLMSAWNNHLGNFDVRLIGNLLFLLSFVGLIFVLISKNHKLIPLTPFFIIPFVLLANKMPIFSLIFDLLLKVPLLQELFRFIFTKLSILLTFGYSLFVTFFIFQITNLFPKLFHYFFIILPISLLIYCAPYFSGQLISPIVRINIPNSYFQLNQYLQSQNPSRILTLPLFEPSGWIYTSWEYQGSGLIWFGSPQSFFDRDSDRWQSKNEQAYREFRQALYSNNHTDFKKYLNKYQVGYVLIDDSIIPPSPKNREQIKYKYETEELIQYLIQNQLVSSIKQFDNLKLYTLSSDPNLIETKVINNYVGPQFRWHFIDPQYDNDYITTNTGLDTRHPFRAILNNFNKIDQSIKEKLNLTTSTKTIYSNPKTITSYNNTQGISVELNNFEHNVAYVIGIESEYHTGIPLRFCLKNPITSLCVVEDETSKSNGWDYFLVPPQDNYAGYQLELNLISYGGFPSSSTVKKITIQEFNNPLNQSSTPSLTTQSSYQLIFPNYTLIKAKINSNTTNQTLILNQSFSPGWLAFYFDGIRPIFLTNHVLVNNWANGWQLPDIGTDRSRPIPTIYIIFWPQLLQFLGFGLLISTFILIWRQNSSDSR